MQIATRISFVVMVPVLLVCAHAASHFQYLEAVSPTTTITPRPDAGTFSSSTSTPPGPHADTEAQDDGAAEGAVDLYGNQTTDAVARYKLDAGGSLYELHSPRTELPRLGSPKS